MRHTTAIICAAALTLTCGLSVSPARADLPSLLIVYSDKGSQLAVDEFTDTGKFSSVDTYSAEHTTPVLGDLTGYDAVLAYTARPPDDGEALGNVLADYVDSGGTLTLATYAFSGISGGIFSIAGRIMTEGYSPFTSKPSPTLVSGNLVKVADDLIFTGISLPDVEYFHNSAIVDPGLATGALLLATDGAGHNMIAMNADRSIVGLNLFPGTASSPPPANNAELYELMANTLDPQLRVPTPSAVVLGAIGIGLVGLVRRRSCP